VEVEYSLSEPSPVDNLIYCTMASKLLSLQGLKEAAKTSSVRFKFFSRRNETGEVEYPVYHDKDGSAVLFEGKPLRKVVCLDVCGNVLGFCSAYAAEQILSKGAESAFAEGTLCFEGISSPQGNFYLLRKVAEDNDVIGEV